MGEAGGSRWVTVGGVSPLGSTASSAYPLPGLPQIFLLPRSGILPPLRWQARGLTHVNRRLGHRRRGNDRARAGVQSGYAETTLVRRWQALQPAPPSTGPPSANPPIYFFFKETLQLGAQLIPSLPNFPMQLA